MEDSKERLIEAAVRPFSDNAEMKLAAVRMLGELVNPDAVGAKEAIERWDTLDGKKRRSVWCVGLYCVLVIVSATILADGVQIAAHYQKRIRSPSAPFADIFYGSPTITDEQVSRKLTSAQSLLLFGDLSQSSRAEKMKGLWNSERSNPAYFAGYADAYVYDHGSLPPDFLATARRIDPDNAWFTYVAASMKAKDAVKKRPQSRAATTARKTQQWDILDAARFRDSLVIFREARNQSKCESYGFQLHRQRMKLLPQREPSEIAYCIGHVLDQPSCCDNLLKNLTDVVAAKAWLTGEENDSSAFRDLLRDADEFLKKRSESEVESLTGEHVTTIAAFGMIPSLSPIARKFGFNKESIRLSGALERINKRKAWREMRKPEVNSELVCQHGGSFTSNSIALNTFRNIQHPPLLKMEDVTPGRLMEHETLSWVSCYFTWAILVLSLGITAAYRFSSPFMIRQLARRIESLMLPSDRLAVWGYGVLLPILYFLIINRFTPLGGRGFNIEYSLIYLSPYEGQNPPLSLVQFLGLSLLLVLFPGIISYWRLQKRLRAFDFLEKGFLLQCMAAVCAAAFIPMIGAAAIYSSDTFANIAGVLAAFSMLWLIAICINALFGKFPTSFRCAIFSRMLVPVFAFAALLVISAAPYFKATAYSWFKKDQLVKPDQNYPAASRIEHQMALQLRTELRKTLGYGR